MKPEAVGTYLQTRRLKQGLALTALATRLWPLNVLAAIEQGQQAPSVAQLTQLYHQLGIPRNQPLPQAYPIHRLPIFNQKLQNWWQTQNYGKLVANIAAGEALHQLTTDSDRQAVLFYYGQSLAAIGDVDAAQLHLRAGLMFMTPQRPQMYHSLDLLLMAAENAVDVQLSREPNVRGFERAVAIIRAERVVDDPVNLPFVYYQYAQSLLQLGRPAAAVQVLQEGLAWAVAHQVTYLLPDSYLLLALARQMSQSTGVTAAE